MKDRPAGSACRAAAVAASRRLLLVGAFTVAAVLLVTGLNIAQQNNLDVQFHAFQDSRGVTVLSPDLAFNKDFSDRTAVRVKFGVDAISAASDSCARCHPEGSNNGRVVFGVSGTRKYGDTKLTVGGEVSREQFYAATTGQVSLSRDLNKGNTTVASGFSYSLNRPQLHPAEESETQHSFDAFASVTQGWTKTTVTQFGYELNQVNGFQTNPFLRTRVNNVMIIGNSPDTRTRHALTARIRQALPGKTVLEADYRRYHDTWSIDSNAVSVGLSHRFGQKVLAGASYRQYDQTAAYFYQPSYTGTPQYWTGDFRLFPFNSGNVSGKISITPESRMFNMPEGTTLTVQYDRYNTNNGFTAGILTAGFRVPLK